ncbi:putative endomembrane protein [Leishmania major strain Friedlin]|uniref:Transmembrane 9 superfamily member n=1 Tax=Leishmania major TaxID=5664 RepID=Q4QG16_LEIMA|nr:putative endomembrane protein [Leishmania major strain Friedlin]CAG9571133.1 endomembrane_protein_-_putative [Leishmania major strain Friedlin]CAJ03128.1 putative endomembrane protein [Leishmania major strain Friedlin]|eukprot:XP_001681882.1 putative endomembrane protein [Leishmania major strain Friedlin]
MGLSSLLTLAALVCMLCMRAASASKHTYLGGDEVKVFVSKMHPHGNTHETYSYAFVPGCPLQEETSLTLGELLAGESIFTLATDIRFNHNTSNRFLCKRKFNAYEANMLAYAIEHDYRYDLTIDELPVWGAIGNKIDDNHLSIFLHQTFYIGVNGNEIVNVTLETSSPAKLEINTDYAFKYSVVFEPSSVEYANRFSTVFETRYVGSRTRLASLINASLIVLLLLSLIALILSRTLRSEHAKMEREAQFRFEEQDIIDESGWRCLYADVFRVPRHTGIFCAILGCGTQLLLLTVFAIFLSVVSNHRISMSHNLVTFSVFGYACTSGIAGYVSGYQFMGCGFLAPPMASKWIRAFHVTFFLVPVIYVTAFFPTWFIAMIYGTTNFPYFAGVIVVLFVWVFIAYPLCLAGVLCSRYVFRRTERRRNIPHVNQIPRLIPQPPRKLLAPCYLLLVSGILPFIVVFVEFNFVFTSIWSLRPFHLYGFLTITAIFYIVVTACVSVVATFVLLSTENHYWKWMSIGFGASCAAYTFGYAVFFYLFKSSMHGLFMFLLYYAYCFVIMMFLALIGGTVSYFAASYFVKAIYAQAKND